MDATSMIIYLKEILFKPSIYKQTKETLLIMDRARSHFSEDITNIFKRCNSRFILIPPDLTSILQPLDTHIKKTFKTELRNQYYKWLLDNNSENITDSIIIDFIYYAWYKINKVHQKELIIKAFRDDGITLATDGSEDKDCLKIPNEFIEEMKIDKDDSSLIKENDKNKDDEELEEDDEDNNAMFFYNNSGLGNMGQGLDKHQKSIFYYFQKDDDNKMDLD